MTYILFVIVTVIASRSGAGVSTAQIQFKNLKDCEAAKTEINSLNNASAICLKVYK